MTARTIAQSAVSAVSIYMRQVYMWMTAGLAITAVTAFAVASSPDLQMAILGNMVIMIALIVAQFGMVIALGAAIHKMSATTATAVFIAYSALTGLTLSSIFVVYPIGSIANAFLTAGKTTSPCRRIWSNSITRYRGSSRPVSRPRPTPCRPRPSMPTWPGARTCAHCRW